eukprot:UN13020
MSEKIDELAEMCENEYYRDQTLSLKEVSVSIDRLVLLGGVFHELVCLNHMLPVVIPSHDTHDE